jgi:DNA repair exonuclease SbcCD ATPase subunit
MSKKYIIELEAKVDRATGEVEQLRKEIQSLNQQVVQTNKDTTEGIKNVEKATKGTTGAIRRLGASIKQLGLGILIASWQKIQELFGSNQMVLNAFNIAFEALSIIFNDFVNFVTSNFGTVVNFFKAIFKDPLQSVKDLGTAIKNNIIERFESALEVAGFLGYCS